MTSRLIDQILSVEGVMIGVSYVLASGVILVAVVWLLDAMERRRMDRAIARIIKDDRRQTAEDAARWTP